KIWNAYRLIDSWNIDSKIKQPSSSRDALICFENTFNKDLESINDHFDKYRISDALMTAYKLVWDDFCSWLLETVKPDFGSSIDIITFDQIKLQFQNILKLIHPFMPFISEEIWHIIKVRSKPEESLIVSSWPKAKKYDKSILESYETMKQTIGALRKFRKENDLPQKFKLNLICHKKNSVIFPEIISRLGQLDKIEFSDKKINQNGGVLNVGTNEFFIPLDIKIDFEKELIKINEEIKYLEKFRLSINKKLSNPSFVENAPNKIIEFEKKKLSDTEQKIKNLKNRLKKSV
ncbi:MAG: valine--tRNA ligase, partial [Flavobacteriaceae bacterium]|nr:valine--tRNA ligase [Flavobacteriaceae bacterium]